jgi:hypothetical protein
MFCGDFNIDFKCVCVQARTEFHNLFTAPCLRYQQYFMRLTSSMAT